MSERTGIAWTDSTWNPWYGCTKVSPGCAHCYMYRDMLRYGRNPEIVQRSKTKFTEPLRWHEGRRIFTCSWSDWFHEDADTWRDEAWDVIRQTPQHAYQILTKRPERIADHLPSGWGHGWGNVALGVSIENQRWMTRLEELMAVPADTRFVSAEPLLGPLDFGQSFTPRQLFDGLHWVIVGGESGPEGVRREMEVDWLASVVAQCDEAGVSVFVKQDSGPRDSMQGRIPDHLWARKGRAG